MPRITIIMGIYNCASTLKEALDSLYAQTYKDFKLVLCDDGSLDDTYNIAKKYASNYDNILLIKNDSNMGLNATLNRCLEYVDTEFVARMDGDDRSLPHRFEQEINFLDKHPEYAIVSGPMHHFDNNGIFYSGRGKGEITKNDFVNGSPFCHASCMVRAEAYKAVNGYSVDKKLLRVEDFHLWIKMYALGYKGYMLEDPIYEMRDDIYAINRRTWQNRKNEAYVQFLAFKLLRLPVSSLLYCVLPLLKALVPTKLYAYIHRKR